MRPQRRRDKAASIRAAGEANGASLLEHDTRSVWSARVLGSRCAAAANLHVRAVSLPASDVSAIYAWPWTPHAITLAADGP